MSHMMISKAQRHGLQIVVTAENLTPDQIREAADRWPEWIGSERSALALGLPESHTPGGLPIYPPRTEMWHAREYIARVISAHWGDKHTIEGA
jgi:hypothetical protein